LGLLAVVSLPLHRLLHLLFDLARFEVLAVQLLNFLLGQADLLQALPDLLFLLGGQLLARAIALLVLPHGACAILLLLLVLLSSAVLLTRVVLLPVLALGECCRRNHQRARECAGDDGRFTEFVVHLILSFG
jgi:hypothetical protein